jgi:GH15 family glucan-1,4-alpha-glucosidase
MDKRVDCSTAYGLFEYGILDIDDLRLTETVAKTKERLWTEKSGGLARYDGDNYYRIDGQPPNPWFISTLWLAEYYIEKAKTWKISRKPLTF